MIGRSIAQDLPMDPRHQTLAYGERVLYATNTRNPTALLPQNLHISNKESEHNIKNGPVTFVRWLPPPPMQAKQTKRLISHYTLLPVGQSKIATFGSS